MSQFMKLFLVVAIVFTGSLCTFAEDDAPAKDPKKADAPKIKERNPFERDLKKIQDLEKKYEDADNDGKREKLDKKIKKAKDDLDKKVKKITDRIEKDIDKLGKQIDREKDEKKLETLNKKIDDLKKEIDKTEALAAGEDPNAVNSDKEDKDKDKDKKD